MSTISHNAAVLWTGGKDCALAHYEAVLLGHEVKSLVTFAPASGEFLSHPLDFMAYQARAMGIPHSVIEISEPYREGYINVIRALHDEHGIDTLITGDIAEVDGYPNWIAQCSEGSGVDVLMPLWGIDRMDLLSRLLGTGFRVIISCIRHPQLGSEWLGREITNDSLAELLALEQQHGIDPCGENGEFHTLTIDSLLFSRSIRIEECSPCTVGTMSYLRIERVSLQER